MATLKAHEQPEYQRWLRLLKGLYIVKDVLSPYVEKVISEFHNTIMKMCGPFDCTGPSLKIVLNKRTNKWSIIGEPPCTHRCADWLNTIAAEHLHIVRSALFESCDLKQLNVSYWEIVRTFMPPNVATSTIGPAELDLYYLLVIIKRCKLFDSIHDAVEKVLKTRNDLAHAAVQGISTDAEVKAKLEDMIDLLKLLPTVYPSAVRDLEKLQDENIVQVEVELYQREADIMRMFLREAQERSSTKMNQTMQEVQAVRQKVEEGSERVTYEVQAVRQMVEEESSRVTREVQALSKKFEEGGSPLTREVQAVGQKMEELGSCLTREVQALRIKLEEGGSRISRKVHSVRQKVEEESSPVTREVHSVRQKVEEEGSPVTREVHSVRQKVEEESSPVTCEVHSVGQTVEGGGSLVYREVQAVRQEVEALVHAFKEMQSEFRIRDAATRRGTVGARQGFSDEAVADKSNDPITRAMHRIIQDGSCGSVMAAFDTRQKPEYNRWLRTLKGLHIVKEALCLYVEEVVGEFHHTALQGQFGPFCCIAPSQQIVLDEATNKWRIIGEPACTHRCEDWLNTIADEHLMKMGSALFKLCDLTQLNTSYWEIVKTFLPLNVSTSTSGGLAELDLGNLWAFIKCCKLFNNIHDAVEKVLRTRNELAHTAVQGITTDADMKAKLEDMIDLLKLLPTVHPSAVRDLEKVSDEDIVHVDEQPSKREADIMTTFLHDQKLKLITREVQAVGENVTSEVQAVTQNVTSEVQAVAQNVLDIGRDVDDLMFAFKTSLPIADAATNRARMDARKGSPEEAVADVRNQEDPITRAMHRIISADLRGLNVKQFNCYREELEIIATIDEQLQREELEMQLRLIAQDERVKLTCGDVSDLPFSAGHLGLGDNIGIGDSTARVIGYVVDNNGDVYAFTVGHLFTIGGNILNKCIIKARDEFEISGQLMRYAVERDTTIDNRVVHDIALIKVDHAVTAQNVLKVHNCNRHPKINDHGRDIMTGEYVYLSLTTEDGNSKMAQIQFVVRGSKGELLMYHLVPVNGDVVSVLGDSGTLVCSMPYNAPDKLLAFAYIFASEGRVSHALPLLSQIEHLLPQFGRGSIEFFSECIVKVANVTP